MKRAFFNDTTSYDRASVVLGKLNADTLERVSGILGHDVQSRDIVVTNDDVKHIMDGYPDLTSDVIDSIAEVVVEPDLVYAGDKRTGKNNEKTGVVFEKRFNDGNIVCVQFDNPERGTLQITIVYTTEATGPTPSIANASNKAAALTSVTTEPVEPAAPYEASMPKTAQGVNPQNGEVGEGGSAFQPPSTGRWNRRQSKGPDRQHRAGQPRPNPWRSERGTSRPGIKTP